MENKIENEREKKKGQSIGIAIETSLPHFPQIILSTPQLSLLKLHGELLVGKVLEGS